MDSKTLSVLEYSKVLDRLVRFCDFSASAELAHALKPTGDYEQVCTNLAKTSEACRLLSSRELTIGGAHDIREQADLASRGGVLEPSDLLDVRSTLVSMRDLRRSLEKVSDEYHHLAEIALRLPAPTGIVEAITRSISDNGEILDTASPMLASVRAELRVAHDRLVARLQKYLTDPATLPMLQETLITQRDGRYVIPLRAEFKGQLKSVVHDQSSTGATLFVEPLAVVELNNAYRELQLAERDEERRVLTELSAQIGNSAGEINPGVSALAELDLIFAKAKYAYELKATEPVLHKMDGGRKTKAGDVRLPTPTIRLLHARHPLLDPTSVVPIDVELAPQTIAVVITGPNTGGKTVSLKTIGLLILMAQSGLHIPAQSGSQLSCFKDVWADIGDEQSIEQSLSTFSGHITNIIRILKAADNRCLVLLDELGAGTDPQEGSALARAILSSLLERGVASIVATHYPELKSFAHNTPGVVNASVEFDVRTLRPTYKLTIGLPGRSNALAIARRLGLPEAILTVAQSEINPDVLRADRMLDSIRKQRNQASHEREKAVKTRARADDLLRELEDRLESIEAERETILEEAREQAEAQVNELHAEIRKLKQQMQRARQPLEVLEPVVEKAKVLKEKVQKPTPQPSAKIATGLQTLSVGDIVVVRSLKKEGVVTTLGAEDVEVQVGTLRVRARLADIARAQTEGRPPSGSDEMLASVRPQSATSRSSFTLSHPSPGMDLHLRGQRIEEALEMLYSYLDQAHVAGLPFVRIVHGKGTGKLRQAVREALKRHPYISSFEEGLESEGGAGVTVVKFAAE